MNLLNRYLLRLFLRPFLTSLGALIILIFISQLFDRLDKFLADGVNFSHVIGYLLASMPVQIVNIMPVACLLGTMFVIGNLARTREYIAALAGGIPPEKFMGGILLAGLGLSFMTLLFNEIVVPPATRYAKSVFREKIRHMGQWEPELYGDFIVSGEEGRLWSTKLFNRKNGTMERVIVDSFANGHLQSQVDAASALWQKNGWLFRHGILREYDSAGLAITAYTPFEEKLFPFTEKPSELVTQEPWPEEMNFKDLQAHVRRLSSLGVPVKRLETQLMMKLAFPFACFVVVCLGIPMAMKGQGSRAMGIAAGGALSLLYIGFVQFGEALAQRLIPPIAGAWLGNFVFSGVAAYLWWRLRRSVY